MRKSCLLLVLVLLIAACTRNEKYTLHGVVNDPNFEGLHLYFMHNDVVDTTVIVNGEFSFEGVVSEPTMAILQTERGPNRQGYQGTFVLEPGAIYYDLITDSLSGTTRNDYYHLHIFPLAKEYEQLVANYLTAYELVSVDPAQVQALTKQTDSLYNLHLIRMNEALAGLYRENRDNAVGVHAIAALAESPAITLSSLEAILDNPTPRIAEDSVVRSIIERLRCLDNTSAGKLFTDFQGINYANGEPTSLAAMIKGKVALVDFWASWCRPCREAIKHELLPIYSTYAAKGLTIVGVDVWDKIDKHDEAVKDLGIQYPQLIDTTHHSTSLYGIMAIPQIILIDKDGTILARDLSGDAIEEGVKKALGL